ncbi:MAG: preprotein translocase subunit SecA [Candidatus Pacebacteria bacterium]|nr:preprotein translocase subunit SecA [Candidatus Paceibacterota bacterium]
MTTTLQKLFGDHSTTFVAKAQKNVTKINALESEIKALSDSDFPNETLKLKERLEKGESLDDVLPRAFALTREAAFRMLGQRHYDVQLVGGMALHQGNIAEMRTGEGKTLVATLAVYLNALTGKGVHVITVNDYLARRDATWMGQIYNFLGLSIGVINSQQQSFVYDASHTTPEEDKERDETGSYKVQHEFLRPSTRAESYNADITYGTNHEFGFDYLRDNLAISKRNLVQRGHEYAVVDEIDSILIDEARTPLIISLPSGDSDDFYRRFATLATELKVNEDYTVDEKQRAITMTDSGITHAEKVLEIHDIYTEKGIKYVHHLETAVKAQALYIRDKEYVVKDDEIIIVDPFTGRLQPGRRWSEGLHQAIEAKEGVKIKEESRTAASITYQNFFRFYTKLSGMTGTAKTSAEEFYSVYRLDVVTVPTHRPVVRLDENDFIFQTEQGKWKALAKEIKKLHENGQPVLIGTISIEKNELLSAYLKTEGVPHTILNAKNHEQEGEIIANAGKKGAVTIATNMAGRGIDIKLGGAKATTEEGDEVRTIGGLAVFGTERHEARRIDDQLRGRAGRQGDPGYTQFFVSLDDDLMRIFGSDNIKKMMGRFGIPEDEPIKNSIISKGIKSAQAKIEGFHFDARKHTLEYDDVLNHQRETIYRRRRALLLADKETITSTLEELKEFSPLAREVIEKKEKEVPEEVFMETVRRIILHVTDLLWVEHLETMDYLRSSVNLRAYGQRDPLVEYRREGLRMFRDMEVAFRNQSIDLIENIKPDTTIKTETISIEPISVEIHETPRQFAQQSTNETPDSSSRPESHIKGEYDGVGRNDPCPCGSGKKFKKCHGANA